MTNEQSNESERAVPLTPYIMRFTLVFVAFSIVALFVTNWFKITGNAGLSIGILMASAVAAGQKFMGDQKRIFGSGEKTSMALYSMLVSLLVSVVLLVGFMLVLGETPLSLVNGLLQFMPVWLLVASLLFAAALNFGVLYLAYGFLARKIFEGMVKRGEV